MLLHNLLSQQNLNAANTPAADTPNAAGSSLMQLPPNIQALQAMFSSTPANAAGLSSMQPPANPQAMFACNTANPPSTSQTMQLPPAPPVDLYRSAALQGFPGTRPSLPASLSALAPSSTGTTPFQGLSSAGMSLAQRAERAQQAVQAERSASLARNQPHAASLARRQRQQAARDREVTRRTAAIRPPRSISSLSRSRHAQSIDDVFKTSDDGATFVGDLELEVYLPLEQSGTNVSSPVLRKHLISDLYEIVCSL